MGKSLKNFIPIADKPNDMYGKIMSIVDDVIFDYFELVTRVPMDDIRDMKAKIVGGENPMQFKKKLALEIVTFYHGKEKAAEAEKNFHSTFQKGEIPEDMMSFKLTEFESTLMEILTAGGVVSSKGDFRRLVEEGAITNLDTDEKVTDVQYKPEKGMKFKIGKRRFVKII
ncbi:MAG: hypothetical protein WDN09_00860 [bacterium]